MIDLTSSVCPFDIHGLRENACEAEERHFNLNDLEVIARFPQNSKSKNRFSLARDTASTDLRAFSSQERQWQFYKNMQIFAHVCGVSPTMCEHMSCRWNLCHERQGMVLVHRLSCNFEDNAWTLAKDGPRRVGGACCQ